MKWLLTPGAFGDRTLDITNAVTIVAMAAIVLLFTRIRIRLELWLLLGVGGLLYLATPYFALSGSFLDFRMPVCFTLFAIPLIDTAPRSPGRGRAYLVTLMTAVVLRVAFITNSWVSTQPVLADIRETLSRIPEDTVVFTVLEQPAPNFVDPWDRWTPPIKHSVSFASLGRDLFVPATLALLGQFTIIPQPEWEAAFKLQDNNPPYIRDRGSLASLLSRYRESVPGRRTFVLVLYPNEHLESLALPHRTIGSGTHHALIEIDP